MTYRPYFVRLTPEPVDVDRSVAITIDYQTALTALKYTLMQAKRIFDRTAATARLGRGCPAINLLDSLSSAVGKVFENLDEVCKRKIGNLPAPSGLHTLHAKVFDVDHVVLVEKRMGSLLVETWVLRPFGKEVGIGDVEVPKCLLQRNASDILEPFAFRLSHVLLEAP